MRPVKDFKGNKEHSDASRRQSPKAHMSLGREFFPGGVIQGGFKLGRLANNKRRAGLQWSSVTT